MEDGREERVLCLESVSREHGNALGSLVNWVTPVHLGQLVLALTQWATCEHKAYTYPPEQYKDSPPCVSFLYLIQWFSNLRVNQDHLESLLKHRFLDLMPRVSDSVCLAWCLGICIPASYQVMVTLLVWDCT